MLSKAAAANQVNAPSLLVSGDRLEIVPVEDKSALTRFIRVPWRIYRDDPQWIPPLVLERREHLNRRTNPFFQHAEVCLWLALRDGRPVGRVSAQVMTP